MKTSYEKPAMKKVMPRVYKKELHKTESAGSMLRTFKTFLGKPV
jgi:hypothetical protein